VDIWDRITGGGYRSLSVQNEGVQNDPNPGWIHIRGRGHHGTKGARIAPSSSNLFANIWDNNNWIHLDSFYMYDHIDPFIFDYVTNGYSHHMWFTNIGEKRQNAFFPSNTLSNTLPNWGGPGDTVNCQYDWTWENGSTDSLLGGTNGLTWLWLGGPNKNNVWLKATVKNYKMDHYSSSSNPACYIRVQNVFGFYANNDSVSNLGNGGPSYSGHAASIFSEGSYYDIHNMHFGPGNFGNDVRDVGVWDIPGMESFFTAIDTGYNGVSKFYNILSEHKVKYPIIETRNTKSDTTQNPYMRMRQVRYLDQITGYSLAVGIGHSPYNVSVLDAYTGAGDTLYLHNSTYSVISDSPSVWGQPWVKILTIASGAPSYIDTAKLWSQPTFALSGLADTIKYIPAANGPLYRAGTASRPWPSFDIYNVPRATVGPVDIGAVTLPFIYCDCIVLPIPGKISDP
jgi:hypothetical protein